MKKIIFLITILLISCETQKSQTIDLFNAENDANVSCYRIPSILTAVNGDLIAMIDERVPSCGDLKWSRDINIVMRKSFDNGKTWTDIETIVDYPLGQSASDPSMILDEKTNTIFIFYNYMDLDNEKDIYYLRYKKSVDNGKSWSESIDITDQISKIGWEKDFKFITSGRGIQTQDGTLLHCLVNLQKGTHVFGSNDNGNSWFITETPTSPGDESKIIELNDGRWMVNSRVNNLGYRYSHISDDKGKSWISKKEENIIDPGCNGSILKYNFNNKNLLLLTNINNQKERKEIVIRYSEDEGVNWSSPKVIYEGEAAYSSVTQLNNGDVGIFYEADNYTSNIFKLLSIDWIISSK